MKNTKFFRRAMCMLLALIMVVSIVPASILDVISEEEEVTGIDIADMEVGKLYSAIWNYENYQDTYLYKEDPEDPDKMDQMYGSFLKKDLPQNLTVKLMKEGDSFLYVTNEDWPATCYEYRYVEAYELIVLECLEPDDTNPDGYIEGQVGLVMDGEVVTDITIPRGEKTYVFTDLTDKVEGTPSYQWQILVDKEDNRWANILYYDAPYAALTESLLSNSRDPESGKMTIRCIVTSGELKYVSGNLNVNMPAVEEKAADVQTQSSTSTKTRALSAGNMARAGEGTSGNAKSDDAFQIEVSYVYWNNSPLAHDIHGDVAADTFTVTLLPSVAYDGQKNHPVIPGYKAYIRDDTQAGNDNARKYTALEDKYDETSEETHYYVEAQPIVFEHETVGRKVLVYYLPEEVTYRVNHYIQNLENDEYKLIHTDIKTGLSDYPVGENHQYTTADQYADIAGFTPLYYDINTRISANNKTEIDIYYDRNYYIVDFDLATPDGQKGYGVMPLYVRYGTQLMLSDPTAPGYAFTDWSFVQVYNRIETTVDGNIKITEEKITDNSIIDLYDNPAAMLTIKHNVDYKANWQVATASFTIIYWRENADSTDPSNKNNYSVWATETINNKVSGSKVDCSEYDIPEDLATNIIDGNKTNEKPFFTRANAMSDLSVVVKGDNTSSVNIYYTRNTYHIWFKGVLTGTCQLYEHTHGTDCNGIMFCVREEHTHITSCYANTNQCGVTTEHTHNTTHGNNNSCCKMDIHTHSKSCYSVTGQTGRWNQTSIGNAVTSTSTINSLEAITTADSNGVVAYSSGYNTSYYIKIGRTWYQINNYSTTTSGNSIKSTITKTCVYDVEHSANDGKCVYSCGYTEHIHSDDCKLICKEEAHTHNENDCYSPCTKYEHKHSGNCNSATRNDNYAYALSAKYGADIADAWPTADFVRTHINPDYNLYGWSNITSNQLVTKRINMTSDLCDTTDYVREGTSSTAGNSYRDVYYLFESFDQTSPANGNLRQLNGSTYFDSDDRYQQRIEGLNQGLSAKTITGMKPVSTSSTNSGNNVFLYYTRNRHSIIFENVGVEIYTMSDIMFEQPLDKSFFDSKMTSYSGKTAEWEFVNKNGEKVMITIPIPETPSSYEEGSVYFAGWYTTPLCADGTEYNFANNTMPDAEIKLFAKWMPTYWDVTVYQEEPTGTDDEILKEYSDVPFGTLLTIYGSEPERKAPVEGYIFAGWYYVDENGTENRFDFNTMAVKHDYKIYAKWTSEVPVEYTVRYVAVDADGNEIAEIADQTKGVSLAGISKSFMAKIDKELYDDYQTGYFPVSREQTFKMSEKKEENIITFKYKHSTKIDYKITHVFTSPNLARYTLDGSETLTLEWTEHVTESNSALLTVSFRDLIVKDTIRSKLSGLGYSSTAIDNIWNEIITLSPDAYSKRLILEAGSNQDDNEIIFHWEGRTNKAIYEVHHLYESLTEEGKYEELSDPQVFEVVVDSSVSFEKLLIKGYEYAYYKTNHSDGDQIMKVFEPKVGADGKLGDGLIINVYYNRETYNYTIKFYDDELYTPISGVEQVNKTGKYGEVIKISDVAKKIDGYDLSNGNDKEELIFNNQEIICYYKRQSVKYEYILVGVGGSLNNFQEEVAYGNTPKAVSLTIISGYIVQGWEYSIDGGEFAPVTDAQATVGVNGSTLQPVKPELEDMGKTIYFRVTLTPTSFTITNSGDIANNQAFIYVITDNVTNTSVRVTVMGNTSTTIQGMPEGNYTVALEDNWSWRYDRVSVSNQLTPSIVEFRWDLNFDGEESVTFTYSDPNDKYVSTTDKN